MITVKADTSQLSRAVATLKRIPNACKTAAKRAMRRVVQSVRQEAVTQTKTKYYIKPAKMRKAFSSQLTDSGGIIKISGARMNIANFHLTPNKLTKKRRPLYGAVRRDHAPHLLPGAFLIPLGGKAYAFTRTGKGRWDIQGVTRPAVPQLIDKPEILAAMEEKAQATFSKRIEYEAMRMIGAAT